MLGPSAEACDGLDNDCNGQTDEGCECRDGEQRACGLDVGACQAGTQTCAAGSWGACQGSVGPAEEVCHDGLDNDCDGTVDEGCVCDVGRTVRVDNDIAGSGYSEDPAANWLDRPTGSCHGTYRYLSHPVGDGTRRGRAIWRPAISAAGWWRVVTSFRATENRTPDADYILHADQGERVRRTVSQRNGSDCTRVTIGTVFCQPGGNCRLVLDGTDDGESDSADITTFELVGCGPEPPGGGPGEGCAAIAANPAYELCHDGGETCHGVFTDGSGCRAFCRAAGMSCVAAFGGEPGCQKEPHNPLACDQDTGHQSDWCECAR